MEFTKKILGLHYLNYNFALQGDADRRLSNRMLNMISEPAGSDESVLRGF